MNEYQAFCGRHAYDDTNVIVPMKFLTVSVYDAEYLIINKMANCHKEKIGKQIMLQASSRSKNSSIDFGLSQSAFNYSAKGVNHF